VIEWVGGGVGESSMMVFVCESGLRRSIIMVVCCCTFFFI